MVWNSKWNKHKEYCKIGGCPYNGIDITERSLEEIVGIDEADTKYLIDSRMGSYTSIMAFCSNH